MRYDLFNSRYPSSSFITHTAIKSYSSCSFFLFFNGLLAFALESMASSSSSHQQNQEFNAFSGIGPAGKRRMACESSRLFDVFINHRGPDVKETLATQLYHSLEQLGIRAFLDSQEKELGTSFPSIIETAIGSAKVYIAVFSKRYAESAWCLAELVLMLQSKAKIIPVFYQVEPWELRHIERGQYAAAFINYEEKGRYLEKLSEWKEALQYLSFTAGEQVYSDRDCQKIVEAVQKEVQRKTCLHVAEYPVGLNNLVEDFERRCLDELVQDFENHCGLEEGKHKAKVVGIFGMGGSGKTTLAKELFNQKVLNYNKASFLFDVREASVRSQLPSLQLKLLKDLFDDHCLSFTSTEEGTSHLKDRLSRSRLLSFLIVVDDIDQVEQLNALLVTDILNKFGNTLVIVTTRDVRVLITGGITVGYHLKGMNRNDGRQLFCWHALGEPLPCSGYEALVEAFVDVCGGLPLSLQVLGRHVRGSTANYWRSELDKASKTLRREVKERLRISFNALDGEQKHIFMDIACFFVGKPKSIAERVWEQSGWNAHHALETLKDKCLVEEITIGSLYSEWETEIGLRMHDHLRDLGREMALELSPPHRLWRPQDLKSLDIAVFKTLLSRTDVRGFSSIFDESVGSQVTFFLSHSDSYLETSASLLWLQLEENSKEQPSIPSWIPLQNLHCLKIGWGQLKTLWDNSIQAPSQLKELQISQTSLKELPDFLGISDNLEKVFLDARGLPIQGLSLLESLRMNLCSLCLRFSTLKGEQASTKRGEKSLCESLVIENFKFNGEMDWNNGKTSMSGLEKLEISDEEFVSKILISGIHYPSLESIKLHHMENLMEVDLTNLTTLNCLDISYCQKLKRLAGTFDLPNLVLLNISQCPELKQLTFGRDVRVKYFELDGCQNLKTTEFSCEKLVELSIRGCPELMEIPDFEGPCCLERIIIDGCGKLEYLQLNGCHNLKSVYISDCPELEESVYLATLSCMEKIEIKHCEKIQNIMLPTTLISLSVESCRDLQIVEGTGDLTELTKLCIYECPELEELPSLSRQSCLEVIDIGSCEKLQSISGIEEPHISYYMRLHYCSNAVIRNCIHKLKGVPSWGMEMIGRAVNGADSTLNECLFSDANIGVDAVMHIGALKWSELSAVIVCLVVVVDTINNSLPFSFYFGGKNGLKVREGEWIITMVASQDMYHNLCYEGILDVLRRYGIVKNGFWVEVKKGEEWKSVDVLRTIVDRLHNS